MNLQSRVYQTLSAIPLLVEGKKQFDRIEERIFFAIARIVAWYREWVPYQGTGHTFAILCVKRPAYVHLAIANCNSLHFWNPSHRVVLYCDAVCYAQARKYHGKFHYPENVELIHTIHTTQPWQLSKIATLITASQQDQILIDADSRWFCDPHFSSAAVTLLTKTHPFRKHPQEYAYLRRCRVSVPTDAMHYVSAVVRIPASMMTPRVAKQLTQTTHRLLAPPKPVRRSDPTHIRLAEEMAISLVVGNLGKVQVLKEHDGPGDRSIVQSLYYGCTHEIIE